MPKLNGILETALYTDDMERARTFYEGVLQLQPIFSDSRLCAYGVAGRDVLLIFKRGAAKVTVAQNSGGARSTGVTVAGVKVSVSQQGAKALPRGKRK